MNEAQVTNIEKSRRFNKVLNKLVDLQHRIAKLKRNGDYNTAWIRERASMKLREYLVFAHVRALLGQNGE